MVNVIFDIVSKLKPKKSFIVKARIKSITRPNLRVMTEEEINKLRIEAYDYRI